MQDAVRQADQPVKLAAADLLVPAVSVLSSRDWLGWEAPDKGAVDSAGYSVSYRTPLEGSLPVDC